MRSQSESYKIASPAPELTHRSLKKLTYLFGLPLVSWKMMVCEHATRGARYSDTF
jgi:hypothetical protein